MVWVGLLYTTLASHLVLLHYVGTLRNTYLNTGTAAPDIQEQLRSTSRSLSTIVIRNIPGFRRIHYDISTYLPTCAGR
ncbi:hypothetical protein GGS21DRAFT_496298 [Xylaria nigripes]|nr:hypothetical protein GGS21DRAFT_496298 [Xylaria nigripes]